MPAPNGFYSLIETAKANGLEPYGYLHHFFERVPYATTTEGYRSRLPQHLSPAAIAHLAPEATGGWFVARLRSNNGSGPR